MPTITKKTIPPMALIYITESNGSPSQVTMWQYNPNKKYQKFVSFTDGEDSKRKNEGRVLKFAVAENNFKTIVDCIVSRIADMNPTGNADSRPQIVVSSKRQHEMLQNACSNIDSKTKPHVVYLDARIQDIFKYCDDADKIGLDYAAKKMGVEHTGEANNDAYKFAAVFLKTERLLSGLTDKLSAKT